MYNKPSSCNNQNYADNTPFQNQLYPSYSNPTEQYRPNFPEVNPSKLKKSAEAFKPLMKDVDVIIHEFTESEDFAYKILDAAQRSETEKIKKYIRDIGVDRPIEIKYNPDGLRLKLTNQVNSVDCCKLRVSLQW